MMRHVTWSVVLITGLALVLGLSTSFAKDSSFQAKFRALAQDQTKLFKVTARPGEDIPEATLNLFFGANSTVSVSRGKPPKDILDESDINGVVNRNLRTVKFCYCEALKKDPAFEGQAIVEMQIQTSGKVQSVEIQPDEMAEHRFGKCLSQRVAKWEFPSFTGKKEDGMMVKSIGYEFPLEFAQAER
jgi:hypothetical protein